MVMNKKEVIKLVVVGATLGVTGLAIVYRRQIFGFIKGGKKGVEGLAAAKVAEEEYKAWGNGAIKEGDSRTMERLRSYWKEGAEITTWSDQKMINEAWSAAFVSYAYVKANPDTKLKRSASHSVYIRDAVSNRKNNAKDGFFGYKINEVDVKVGDLVCYPRQSGVTYDSSGNYASHCDIVTKVEKDNARTIGGNVSNSVTVTDVPLKNGKIDGERAKNKYFVVIKPKKEKGL